MTAAAVQPVPAMLSERIGEIRAEFGGTEHGPAFERQLHDATEQALACGEYRALDEVVRSWQLAAQATHGARTGEWPTGWHDVDDDKLRAAAERGDGDLLLEAFGIIR